VTGRGLQVLLLADTHLGFDLPLHPRVKRRRRGPDFFANFRRALAPARRRQVDLVVHGGDLLFRSKVRRELVYRAFEPLIEVASGGVSVVVVPGNHERSAIPYPLLASHPGVHVLDRPRTVRLEAEHCTVLVAGFPFQRRDVRARFPELVEQTGWRSASAPSTGRGAASPVRLLCIHQTVEGARVGPSGYTFRHGRDIVRGSDIPPGFAAVLCGHIHRHQVLTSDLAGRPLAAPVLYPGSIERTSFAERREPKGFMTLKLAAAANGGRLVDWRFARLPARPMIDLEVDGRELDRDQLTERLRRRLSEIPEDAVVRLSVSGPLYPDAADLLSAERLRSLAPATMSLGLTRPLRGARTSQRPPST
jgi:DNA repair exonuclease SbcCD nuclease subunit